ncbi:hypothetical protein DIPPA_33598 [Diplonema papillatum]|nr:hypothetical protein DIPPA_33598 [Diplonema papillatum]
MRPPDAPSPVVPPTPLPPRNALPDDTSVQQQRNPTPASRPPSSPGRALVALPGAAQPDGGSDDTSSSSSVGSTLGSLNGRVFCDFDPSAGIPREHLAGVESLVEDPRPQGHPADASRHSAVARQVLAAAARKDAHVASLAEFILRYLQQGAAIHRPVAKPAPRLAPLFARLSQDRAAVLVFSRDPAGGAQQPQGGGKPAPPPPAALVETVPLRDVVGIALGQGSEAFHKVSKHLPAPDGAVDVNSLHKVPKDTAGNITPENKGLFFYRSLTLHLKKGKTLDFVAASDSDFESWVFALARLTGQVPAFGAPLDSVRSMRGFDTLRSEEKQFCQVHHLPPLLYLNARLQCLQQANATWLTLYDIRTLSGLDLLHAQKVFDLWHGLGWIDRQTMSPIRYLEKFPGEASSLVDVIDAQRRRDRRRDVENTQNRGWE